jgi:hypothetical protein
LCYNQRFKEWVKSKMANWFYDGEIC